MQPARRRCPYRKAGDAHHSDGGPQFLLAALIRIDASRTSNTRTQWRDTFGDGKNGRQTQFDIRMEERIRAAHMEQQSRLYRPCVLLPGSGDVCRTGRTELSALRRRMSRPGSGPSPQLGGRCAHDGIWRSGSTIGGWIFGFVPVSAVQPRRTDYVRGYSSGIFPDLRTLCPLGNRHGAAWARVVGAVAVGEGAADSSHGCGREAEG